jgi:hypothetical protein
MMRGLLKPTRPPHAAHPRCQPPQKLVQERFDSERFSEVFTAGSGPPAWLSALTSDPRGRKLLYELSAAHKNCLLLNFAMQRILYEVGAVERRCLPCTGCGALAAVPAAAMRAGECL